MSYRNDQWFKLDLGIGGRDATSNDAGFSVPFADNDNFVYPTRRVRTLTTGGKTTSTVLKRGYIRSLLTGGSNARKCQFQFNPASINQSVAQNSTIINFLQMDPYQYAQPMPGNVTFQYRLFFDRTMEVNNPPRGVNINTVSAWEHNNPSEIGVLHDLSSLFSIIGVGVSDYMDQQMQNAQSGSDERAAQFLNRIIDVSVDGLTEDATGQGNADLERSTYRQSLSDLVNINKGNSAFLLPLPVRIVFSSLYIVEGLVNDVDVLFTKFSTQMVPVQCSVTMTVEAKYIGFAKEKTFFTHVLDDLKNNPNVGTGQYGIRSDIDGSHLEAVKADLGRAEISVINTETNPTAAFASGWSSENLGQFISRNEGLGTPSPSNAESTSAIETTKAKQIKLYFPDASTGADRISSLFDAGVPTQIDFNAKVAVWRVGDPTIKQAVRSAIRDAGVSTATYGPTGQIATTGEVVSIYKSTFETVFNSIKELESTPTTFSITSDIIEGVSITRNYPVIQQLWDIDLTSGGRYEEEETEKAAVLSCSTSEEWNKAREGYIVSVPSTFGLDDRSGIAPGTDQRYTEPLSSQNIFDYWLIYELGIAVNIDGNRSSRSIAIATPHVWSASYALPDLEKIISLDWETN